MEAINRSCAFSLSRFGRLAQKHYTDNARRYLTMALVMWGVIIFMYWINGWPTATENQSGLFSMLWIVWLISSLTWIKISLIEYFQPKTAVSAFTLPASPLEKYLFAWLNSLLGGTGLVWLLVAVTDAVSNAMQGVTIGGLFDMLHVASTGVNFFLFFVVLSLHMLTFLCFLVFGRYYVLSLMGVMALLGVVSFWIALLGIEIWSGSLGGTIQYFPWPHVLLFFIQYLLFPVVWAVMAVAGYFKLRERAVH